MIAPIETPKIATPNIPGDVERWLRRRAKVLPHRSNWASDLADPCLRRLVYHRTCWEKAEPPSPYLEGIFETGRRLENTVIYAMNGIGEHSPLPWELVKPSIPLNDKLLKEHEIGCNPDVYLKVMPEGERPQLLGPVDLKGCNGNTFRTINDPADLDNKPYMRRYPAQVMMYELASNFEIGWLFFYNKDNLFDVKMIPIPLDYGYADTLLATADHVNAHVRAGTLPEQLNVPEECGRCGYRSYCCPACATGGNLKFVDHDELEQTLLRLDELRPEAKEIGSLEKHRDRLLENFKGQDISLGEHIITWKKLSGVHPPKPAAPWEQWRKSITRIGSTDDFLESE